MDGPMEQLGMTMLFILRGLRNLVERRCGGWRLVCVFGFNAWSPRGEMEHWICMHVDHNDLLGSDML